MPLPTIAPMHRETLTDRIHDALRDGILDGVCTPGERLDIPLLMTAYETSRPTVMTALERLVAAGLVERGHRAFQVIRPSDADGSQAAAALQWVARALGDTAAADTAIAAVRQLDDAGGRGPLDAVLEAFVGLCSDAENTVFAAVIRSHLDALTYMAQFRPSAAVAA